MKRSRSSGRLLTAALAAGFALSGAGCAAVSKPDAKGGAGSADGSLPESIRSAGVVRVATDPTYPPFERLSDDQRTIVGLDPDLLGALGEELGIEVELVRVGFDSIIPGLQAGRFDLAVSGMTDTVERQQQVTFLDYFSAGGAVVTHADDEVTDADIRARLCGAKVGVQTGTITIGLAAAASQECAGDGREPLDVRRFPSVSASVLAMSSQRVAYVWTDAVNAASFVENGGGRFDALDDGTPPAPTGMAFAQESTELVEAFRAALQRLIDDGTYREILDEYGLASGAVTSAEVNGATD